MNKICLYLFFVILSINTCSCTMIRIMDDINTFSSRNKEEHISGNIFVYIDNRTNELLVVYLIYFDIIDDKIERSMEIARVSKGETKMVNIKTGRAISVMGGNTRKTYIKQICEKDQETFTIW